MLTAGLCLVVSFCVPFTNALPYGAGTYGTCTYGTCGITITSSGTVAIGLQPTASGVVTIAGETITVTTGASTGYTLSLESDAALTTLAGTPDSIPASSGTIAVPIVLATNTWGYRVDTVGGFGAGPTSAVSNASSSPLTFAGITANGSPGIIKSTSVAAPSPGATTDFWYGVKADTSIASGTYTRTVVYTATTNN